MADKASNRPFEGAALPWRASAPPPVAAEREGSGAAPIAAVPGLIRLRWVIIGGLALILLAATAAFRIRLPIGWLLLFVALMAATNLALARALARCRPIRRSVLGAVFSFDVVILTGILQLTGGPANPFSVLYLVPITVAAVSLGTGWTWLIAALSIAGFGFLFVWSLPLPIGTLHLHVGHMPDHFIGMWLAFAAAALVIAYFVERTSRALAQRERELAVLRAAAARNERLASLTTLAAGAAHELSTPLATIAVAARELERAAAQGSGAAGILEDAQLIRAEIDRCHEILDQMSGRASGSAADARGPIDLRGLMSRVRQKLGSAEAGRLEESWTVATSQAALPEEALVRVLVCLVKNAFEATAAPQKVFLNAAEERGALRFTVRDEGHGMSSEVLARAGEPFFTTKQPGGFGLGLFLAHHFAETFGGSLRLDSLEGAGTTATLELPLQPHVRP